MTVLKKTRIIVDPNSIASCADVTCPANSKRMGTFGTCLADTNKPFPQHCQVKPKEASRDKATA